MKKECSRKQQHFSFPPWHRFVDWWAFPLRSDGPPFSPQIILKGIVYTACSSVKESILRSSNSNINLRMASPTSHVTQAPSPPDRIPPFGFGRAGWDQDLNYGALHHMTSRWSENITWEYMSVHNETIGFGWLRGNLTAFCWVQFLRNCASPNDLLMTIVAHLSSCTQCVTHMKNACMCITRYYTVLLIYEIIFEASSLPLQRTYPAYTGIL